MGLLLLLLLLLLLHAVAALSRWFTK